MPQEIEWAAYTWLEPLQQHVVILFRAEGVRHVVEHNGEQISYLEIECEPTIVGMATAPEYLR